MLKFPQERCLFFSCLAPRTKHLLCITLTYFTRQFEYFSTWHWLINIKKKSTPCASHRFFFQASHSQQHHPTYPPPPNPPPPRASVYFNRLRTVQERNNCRVQFWTISKQGWCPKPQLV